MGGVVKKLAIVVGDTTTHGGEVLTGAPKRRIMGLPMAHLGSDVVCPIHGATKIITAQKHYRVDEMPLAVEGDLTSCGAFLIAGKQKFFRVETFPQAEEEASTANSGAVAEASSSATTDHAASSALSASRSAAVCDERFQLLNQQQSHFGGASYALLQDNRCVVSGTLDSQGRSAIHGTEIPATVHVALSAPSPIME
jgi:uncharacterized Zn-binding protein involved in type VI secretion